MLKIYYKMYFDFWSINIMLIIYYKLIEKYWDVDKLFFVFFLKRGIFVLLYRSIY